MKNRWWIALLVVSASVNVWMAVSLVRASSEARAHETPSGEELADYMAMVQRHAHKLGLSIESKNQPLAQFYAEELEETFEKIEATFPEYDGHPIARLVETVVDPVREPLEDALKAGDWNAAQGAYGRYLDACNGCHAAAGHPFVKIVAPSSNPFNQSFETK